MNADQIVKEAEQRLAEIEAEASKLRALIAAAKGYVPAPLPQTPGFYPVVVPYPVYTPPTPWPHDGITCTQISAIDGAIVYGGMQHLPSDLRFTLS